VSWLTLSASASSALLPSESYQRQPSAASATTLRDDADHVVLLKATQSAPIETLLAIATNSSFIAANTFTPTEDNDGLPHVNPSPTTVVISQSWEYSAWDIPPTGTGKQYASRCEDAKRAWSSALDKVPLTTATQTVTNVYESDEITLYSFETYETCGFTRISRSSIYGTEPIFVATDILPVTTLVPAFLPGPSPTCSFSDRDCNGLWEDHAVKESAWSADTEGIVRTISLAQPPSVIVINKITTTLIRGSVATAPVLTIGQGTFTPRLDSPQWFSTGENRSDISTMYTLMATHIGPRWNRTSVVLQAGGPAQTWTERKPSPAVPLCTPELSDGSGGAKCTIIAEEVKILYFPVPTTVSRDMCASAPAEGPITSLPTEIPLGKWFPLSYKAQAAVLLAACVIDTFAAAVESLHER